MNAKERFELITRNTEELITTAGLERLLETKDELCAYIGFEPSGLVHLCGPICVRKLNDLVNAGFEAMVLLADWHAWINDKFDGNIEHIRASGRYMEECFSALGLDPKVKFIYASELIARTGYWERVLRVAKHSSLSRVKRAMTIMGRDEDESITDTSKFFYPAMQVADIFELDVDIALGGMDQRKAHMLARDVCEKLGWHKPIALHTPILPSLKGGERMDQKMSKSMPETCVFVHDSPAAIKSKLRSAYCPEGSVIDNPVLDICRHLVFSERSTIVIERKQKFGGTLELELHELLEKFKSKAIHPLDLKNAVAAYLIEMLKPVRRHFDAHPETLTEMRTLVE